LESVKGEREFPLGKFEVRVVGRQDPMKHQDGEGAPVAPSMARAEDATPIQRGSQCVLHELSHSHSLALAHRLLAPLDKTRW
jgi:hypothetical protein